MGALNWVEVRIEVQQYLLMTVFASLGTAIFSIFENRYFVLFGENSWWRVVRRLWLALNYALGFAVFVPLGLQIPDQEYALMIVQKRYPNIPFSNYPFSIFIGTLDHRYILYPVILMQSLSLPQILFFQFLVFVNVKQLKGKLSKKTYELQHKFFRAVTIQIICPVLILSIPILHFILALTTDHYNQTFNNLSVASTSLHVVGGSVVSIVENRYFIIFARESRWKNVRYPFLFLNYVMVFTCYIPLLFHLPDIDYAVGYIKENYPSIPLSSFSGPLLVITLDNFYMFITVFIAAFTFVAEVTVFNTLLLYKMRNRTHRTQLSSKTYEMQKKFLIAIFGQISIPTVLLLVPAVYVEFSIVSGYYNQGFNNIAVALIAVHGWVSTIIFTPLIILVLPVLYFAFSVLTNYYNQALNNLCVVSLSLHGWVSAVVMLLIHTPYRNFCLNRFGLFKPP
ncbi:unnamed protein product [Caenorhabditis brenneri]